MKIRDVSLKYGLTTRALAYYEEMGLIESSHAQGYAYRCYDDKALMRIEQILILRRLEISIKDIQRILASGSALVLIKVLREKIDKIDHETVLLKRLKDIVLTIMDQVKEYDVSSEMDLRLLYAKANEVELYIDGFQDAQRDHAVTDLAETVAQLEKMPDIRIIRLPRLKMARSGHTDLGAFDTWWSSVKVPQQVFPRDFLWFNPHFQDFEWLFALPNEDSDTVGYEVFDFPGGLYAVATAFDDDDVTRVNRLVHRWADESRVYEVSTLENDEAERYDMGHIVGCMLFEDGTKREQMDLFIPFVERRGLQAK